MDPESQWTYQESPQSGDVAQENANCVICRRSFLLDSEANNGFEAMSTCGECRTMFLEDLERPVHISHLRRSHRGRRRYRSSESIEDIFSQEFSCLINLVRQNQRSIPVSVADQSEQEAQLYGDSAHLVLPRSSSHTPESRSRRWRRAFSDNDSEGFDNMDSLFGESDSNFSFGNYGALHGESDAVSISAYGGDSDASADGHGSTFDGDLFIQLGDENVTDGDTDIDPMHAGLDHWYSDDEDVEWEEADIDDGQTRYGNMHQHNWQTEVSSPTDRGGVRRRMHQMRHAYAGNIFANLEQPEIPLHVGNADDYLDARGFEELLEHLAGIDGSRRGAPAASASFVWKLPRIIINAEHEKMDGGLVCPVCKDPLAVDTEANQLPCSHLYHPDCILPWLSTRNSCPVCRYELPTDDKDYEEGKRNARSRTEIHEIQQQDLSEDSSSDIGDDEAGEVRELSHGRAVQGNSNDVNRTSDRTERENRRGWLLFAAAPIVGIVGIALVLWFQSPHVERSTHCITGRQIQQTVGSSSGPGLRENRRRWWSLF